MIYGNQATWDGWSEADHQAVLRAHADLQADLTAVEIAGRLPEAEYDPIEVRRIMDKSEFGMDI